MNKRFFEAFPTLQLNKSLTDQFENIDVNRITMSSNGAVMRIYIDSSFLIEYKDLRRTEKEIENQIVKNLYDNDECSVRLMEHYNLSTGYSVYSLMNEYEDSIMSELKASDHVLYQLLNHGSFEFPSDNCIQIELEDTIISHSRERDLLDFFDKILNERCGIGADIKVNYKEAAKSKAKESADKRIEEEIRRISEQSNEKALKETEEKKSETMPQAPKAPKALKPSDTSQPVKGRNLTSNLRPRKSNFSQAEDNPDVYYGRDFDESPIPISDIIEEIGDVVISGQVINFETRELRNERTLALFDVTDFTDTISVKIFLRENQQERLLENVKKGAFITLKGKANVDKFDNELSIGYVQGIKKGEDKRVSREDTEQVKRVELHCHTKMSDMDGVSDVATIIERAASWGHPAIAITDHGIVQAFTDAFHALPGIRAKHPDFKLIYGTEGYLVDDYNELVRNPISYSLDEPIVVFDIRTTGSLAKVNGIIEIAAVRVVGDKITESFNRLINPKMSIPYRVEEETGINDSMVVDEPYITEAISDFVDFVGDCPLATYDQAVNESFINKALFDIGIEKKFTYIDITGMSRVLLVNIAKFKLKNVIKHLKINARDDKRAKDTVVSIAEIFIKLLKILKEKEINDVIELNELGNNSVDNIMKSRYYHVILLAKNELGRINLYKLISLSHLKYFHSRPRIPKSLLAQYREGIIIGSACEQGEVFRAILEEKNEADIERIVDFYDYLEVQPIGNNAFLKYEEHFEKVNTDEDLQELNKRIIKLGEEYNKPVVATCDVHFLDPQDEIYRRIIMAGKGYPDADRQAPLYLRTTQEMMDEFAYLSYEKAYEIVVTNTNMINDMIDYIEPVRPDKCPPVIDDSDVTLRDICYKKAHEIYGPDLPDVVSKRLERELNSIISNGFAVMYIIAQKLVWKSLEDGYLVGSRGSVGSSFVATMAGITEVNPLTPHYYCSKCHYSDFDSEDVKKYAGKAGCDMPDKKCPNCGELLKKDGFDIPFETFLGFKGNKEPDIDLNFSGEYQANAHKYTEVIFGKGQTFKAGTIGTVAEKTAYGYVKNYYEERGIEKRGCEIGRISVGCTGIRRTTGQHPGGIIVLPHGEEIDSFTPIQHPANDMTSDIITTHFDYHSIDHNLLKLDILGHDDPTMIRRLEVLTGTNPREVPLDDKGVMSLFQNTEALGVTPDDLGGCKLGSLGIPEFGTDFAIQMLIDTKPQAFSDLVRIAGLAHGTDVWLGNAQTLILNGTATISTAICTRDDIMTYLISMGIESSEAFNIMEKVRKGAVAKKKCEDWPKWKEDMLNHGVPDWYIWSCEKIKYMFPRAHAAAYVMMAWRIAYYKIYYPLAYYAAYLSIRATAFNYEMMCQGQARLKAHLEDYRKRVDSLSNKEQDELKDMRIVEEMYARGFEFMPIDIFRADAHACIIIDGKIMPHIGSIEGLGEKAADAVVEACKDGPFLSRDDFRERTKITKTSVDKFAELGLLGDLPESNQLSLFDMM